MQVGKTRRGRAILVSGYVECQRFVPARFTGNKIAGYFLCSSMYIVVSSQIHSLRVRHNFAKFWVEIQLKRGKQDALERRT